MSVLRRAYVPVEPDLTGFDESLKDKLRKAKPGDRIGKELGGQLNRSLARLDLTPINIKANPKSALAAIETTQARLRELGRNAETVEIRVQTERALGQLDRFRKQLGGLGDEAGPEAAQGFAMRFVARVGPLLASSPMAPAILTAAAPAFAAIGSGVAAAVVGGAAIGGVIGGVTLAARDPRVTLAGKVLGNFVMGDLEERAQDFVPPALNGIQRVREGWQAIAPALDEIFRASRFVEPLTAGLVSGAKKAVFGFANAVSNADPVIESMRYLFDQLGTSIRDTFYLLSQDADEGASALNDLAVALSNVIEVAGYIVHAGAAVQGFGNEVDKVADKVRYWIEDNWEFVRGLEGSEHQLDLTADGFARGSAEAEAYRKATLGSASASDFARLKQAGMTDSQLAALDASGLYRAELERTIGAAARGGAAADAYKRATEGTADAMDFARLKTAGLKDEQIAEIDTSGRFRAEMKNSATATIAAAEAQRVAQRAAQGHSDALDELSTELRKQSDPVFALRDAQQKLKEAQDRSAEAVKKHKAGSVEAREATRNLTTAALDLQNRAGALGSTFNGRLTPQMYATLRAAGLTERQINDVEAEFRDAKKAADAYSGRYVANASTTGVPGVRSQLDSLLIRQQALKKGISVSAARSAFNKNAYARGGPVRGAGTTTSDDIPAWLSNDEHVWTAREVAGAGGHKRVERLRQIAAAGELPPGFAAGGRVRWPYPTTAGMTRVPSEREAMSAVTPAVPAGGRTDQWIIRAARALVGAVGVISTFRPGARTSSGNLSYHALRRAVDFAPSMRLAQAWNRTYGSRTKEEITPWRQYDIHNGRAYHYSAGLHAQHSGRNAHVHIAMAGGGVIREPVVGVGQSGRSYSFGERGPETVTPGTAGGDTFVFHISGPVASRQAAEDMVVDAIASAKRKRRI